MGQESRTKRVKNEIRKYCMNMSAHGVPRVVMSDHCCVKIIWCVVILSCLASFSYHANQIIAKFRRYEKIVNIAVSTGVIMRIREVDGPVSDAIREDTISIGYDLQYESI